MMKVNDLIGKSIIVYDLESTGAKKSYITEIGLLLIQNFGTEHEKIESFEQMFSIPEDAEYHEIIQKKTKILRENLVGKPTFESMKDKIQSFVDSADILVAHSARDDNKMLRSKGIDISNKVLICTKNMSERLFPELPKVNLTYMSAYFAIRLDDAHRALSDAKATKSLFVRLINLKDEKTYARWEKNGFKL